MISRRSDTLFCLLVAAGLVAWFGATGCSGDPSDARDSSEDVRANDVALDTVAPLLSPDGPGALEERQVWYITRSGGKKIGFSQTRVRHRNRSGKKVLEVESFSHFSVNRFGDFIQPEILFNTTETLDNRLLEFRAEVLLSKSPMVTTGRVQGDRLRLKTVAAGRTRTSSIPWSDEYVGLYGLEQSLARRPMKPGETRTLRALIPIINQVAKVQITAADYEPVGPPGEAVELLRIDAVITLAMGMTMPMTCWCDRRGDVLKTHDHMAKVVSVRTTREAALDESDLGSLDMGADVVVKVDRAIPKPHETRRVRYRVTLEGGDPAKVFAHVASQRVKSIDAHTAEVTVHALRPDRERVEPRLTHDPPTVADRQPSSLIESDDPKIVAMAKEAAGSRPSAWLLSVDLERYVHEAITSVNYSQAFATAAEVAETREGDCTEHAVLLAALARARGIPARVTIGLVYMSGRQSFGYHMWTELYTDGRWMPMDATLGRGGIGAAHLKVTHSNLQGTSAIGSFLPVAQLVGRLKIEILDVE